MGKKEKRISVNSLESIMSRQTVTVPLEGADGVEMVIRRTLPLRDMLQFVADAVSACADSGNGTYAPEVIPFAIRANVLTFYANFTLPSSVEKQYELVYGTNAVEQVMRHINLVQYREIVDAVQSKIKHERSLMESTAVRQLNELTRSMQALSDKGSELFSGITQDDVNGMVRGLSAMEDLDRKDVVREILEFRYGDGDEGQSGEVTLFPRSGTADTQ